LNVKLQTGREELRLGMSLADDVGGTLSLLNILELAFAAIENRVIAHTRPDVYPLVIWFIEHHVLDALFRLSLRVDIFRRDERSEYIFR
jgi:hypothetical protein